MAGTFDAQKTTVGRLFSEPYFFRVPAYQRPFSWTREQFDDLVDDIVQADRDAEYFLGTIVLHERGDPVEHDIVDGQQRLTSLALLLAVLRDLIENEDFKRSTQEKLIQRKNLVDGIPEKHRIEVRERDVFNALVTVPGGTVADQNFARLVASSERYIEAASTFRLALSEFSQDDLEKIVQFVNQKCVMIVLSSTEFEEAFRLFTIVNDRGKQLRRVDILKASNLDPHHVPRDAVRHRLAQRWEELENDIGENGFESVFFHLRLILLKDKPQRDLVSEFEDRVFRRAIVQRGEPFLELAFSYAEIYRQLFIDRDFLNEGDANYSQFVSLLFIMDKELPSSEWRAALLFYSKKFGKVGVYEFLLGLEKVVLAQWIGGVRKDERFQSYALILGSIDQLDDGAAVTRQLVYDPEAIKSGVRRVDLYHASFAKYVLLRLELVTAELDHPRLFQAKSIEHVLPQNPVEGGEWDQQHVRADLGQYVHSVGNLVLLTKGRNSAAGNREFDHKKRTYLEPRVSDFPRSTAILGVAEWTREQIEQRTAEASEAILRDP